MSLEDLLTALGNGNNTEGKKGGPGSGPHNPTEPSVSDEEADFYKAPGHINPLLHKENGPEESYIPAEYLSDAQKQSFVESMINKGLGDKIPEEYKNYIPRDLSQTLSNPTHNKRKFGNNLDPETGKFKIKAKRG